MLNLRQVTETGNSTDNSDAEHFSRFSTPNFRVPSYALGKIGEPLDYSQSERYLYGEDGEDDGMTLEMQKLPATETGMNGGQSMLMAFWSSSADMNQARSPREADHISESVVPEVCHSIAS